MRTLAALSLLVLALSSVAGLVLGPQLAPRCQLSSSRIAASPIAAAGGPEDAAPPAPAAEGEDGVAKLVRPEDPTSMLTESERLRRQPVHGLKRKRRSPKIRGDDEEDEQ